MSLLWFFMTVSFNSLKILQEPILTDSNFKIKIFKLNI